MFRVKQFMDSNYPTVSRKMVLKEALSIINNNNLIFAPVVEGKRYYGILLPHDKPLLEQDRHYLKNFKVEEAMLSNFPFVSPEASIFEVPFSGNSPIPVVDNTGFYHGVLQPFSVFNAALLANPIKMPFMSELFESINDGVVLFDAGGRITFANEEALRIWELELKDILYQPADRVFPSTPIFEILKNGQPILGRKFSLGDITVIADRKPIIMKDEIIGVISVFRDISELDRVSCELDVIKSYTERINAMINHSGDGLCVINYDGVILQANHALSEVMGTDLSKIVNRHVTRLEKEGILDHSIALRVLEKEEIVTMTQQSNKGKRWLTTGSPVYDANGKILFVVSTARDVGELLKLGAKAELPKNQKLYLGGKFSSFTAEDLKEAGIITESEIMLEIIHLVLKVAKSDATVLIEGESGTGKELIAKLVHDYSNRKKNGKFVRINCGAIPKELLEAELFGYSPGAFTGASKEGKKGLFEIAHGGSLFLDEIGEMPLDLQVKILRAIQEGEIIRLGSTGAIKINTRIITATNRNLKDMVKEGKFREDLFYRLNVIPIKIPPLRERREDIEPLIRHYQRIFNNQNETKKTFTPETIKALIDYEWPGNVRELKNLVERMVLMTDEDFIMPYHLPPDYFDNQETVLQPLQEALDKVERELIVKALALYGSTYKVAEVLGVSQSTIVRKAKKYMES